MRKQICAVFAAVALASSLLMPAKAASGYVLQNDFESQKVGRAPDRIGEIYSVPLKASLEIAEVDGGKVLAFKRTEKNGNTAAYIDILTGSKKFEKDYCISYDIMIPKQLDSAGGWQVFCNRQTPASGTVFQHAGNLNLATGEFSGPSGLIAKFEFGKWYNLAAVFHENDAKYDVYLDGRLVIDSASYGVDASAKYPERLRVGQAASSGECLVYIDNLKVYNRAIPDNILAADIEVITGEAVAGETSAIFELPVWTHHYDVNTIVVVSVGSVSIVLVLIFAAVILKKGRRAL